jgi:MFS family permease
MICKVRARSSERPDCAGGWDNMVFMAPSVRSMPVTARLVGALGVTQIVSWGTLYYAIAVLGASMRDALGAGPQTLFGAYSLALLISALAAPFVGRGIDRIGARRIMSVGSVVAALALFVLAHVHSLPAFYAAWALVGVAMSMTMYDAAFAALSQHSGASYRPALTALTLFGGLASTVFWPLSLAGLERIGWRDTLVAFAAVNLLLCLPLHLLFIPRGSALHALPPRSDGHAPHTATTAAQRRRAFVALAVAFALNGFIVSALTIHMIAVLQGKGLSLETAVWVGAFFGPLQVAGRIGEFALGRRVTSRTVGRVALAMMTVALGLLIAVDGRVAMALAFAACFGASNGVVTIVRGTVPAELFGRDGYGSLLGRLAAPALLARAIAPLATAALATPSAGSTAWLITLLFLALLSLGAFALAVKRPG